MSLTKPTFREKAKLVWYELLSALGLLSIAITVSLCSGCLNVRTHCNGKVHHAYTGTELNLESIEISWNQCPTLIIPLVVDLPLEIVADTVTLPYDLLKD